MDPLTFPVIIRMQMQEPDLRCRPAWALYTDGGYGGVVTAETRRGFAAVWAGRRRYACSQEGLCEAHAVLRSVRRSRPVLWDEAASPHLN